MEYAICTVPAAPVRKENSHRTEMVNQLLFGETLLVRDTKEEWRHIVSLYDNYEGWVTEHLVRSIDEEKARQVHPFVAGELVNILHAGDQLMHIPMGSALTGFDAKSGRLWDPYFQYDGAFRNIQNFAPALLLSTAQSWLNAPYLWGGKTLMGVDCSGFVQTVFKVCGLPLLRDAWQQAEQGRPISLGEAQPGDLAFFHNDKGRVTHVGLLLNTREIIHASGRVRIDDIDEEGIRNREHGGRTHRFHSVRRVGNTV